MDREKYADDQQIRYSRSQTPHSRTPRFRSAGRSGVEESVYPPVKDRLRRFQGPEFSSTQDLCPRHSTESPTRGAGHPIIARGNGSSDHSSVKGDRSPGYRRVARGHTSGISVSGTHRGDGSQGNSNLGGDARVTDPNARPTHRTTAVPASGTVKVEGLAPTMAQREIAEYFGQQRGSGGGPVKRINYTDGSGVALITFETADVAERVASTKHSFQRGMTVSVYTEHLGPGEEEEEDPRDKAPPSRPISAEDQDRLALLKLLPAAWDSLGIALGKCDASLVESAGALALVCTVNLRGKDRCADVEKWGQEVELVLKINLRSIVFEQLEVSEVEWDSSIAAIIKAQPGIGCSYKRQEEELLVVYQTDTHQGSVNSETITFAKNSLRKTRRKKKEKTHTMPLLEAQNSLLKKHPKIAKVQEQYPELRITFKEKEELVEMQGLTEEIEAFQKVVWDMLENIAYINVPWESALHCRLLETPEARKKVMDECQRVTSPGDILQFTPNKLLIFSLDAKRANLVAKTAQQAVHQRVISLTPQSRQVVLSQKWSQLKTSIEMRSRGRTMLHEDDSSVTMVSVNSQLLNVDYIKLTSLLQGNTSKQQEFYLPEDYQDRFRINLQDKAVSMTLEMGSVKTVDNLVFVEGNADFIDAASEIHAEIDPSLPEELNVAPLPLTKQSSMAKQKEIQSESKRGFGHGHQDTDGRRATPRLRYDDMQDSSQTTLQPPLTSTIQEKRKDLSQQERNTAVNILHKACEKGDIGKVRQLLREEGAVNLQAVNQDSNTALHLACLGGHTETVELLLSREAMLKQMTALNADWKFPLMLACSEGHADAAKVLIKHGAVLDATDSQGRTALHYAANHGKTGTVKLLVREGADVDARDQKGHTSLAFACRRGHPATADALLKLGALRATCNRMGVTPLHFACAHGHLETVRLMLDARVRVDRQNKVGKTALYVACEMGQKGAVDMLLQEKADCEIPCYRGLTPVNVARECGHHAVVKLLLDSGVRPDQGPSHARTRWSQQFQ